ncbi:MAG: (d)CMP kinase [Bdellovibrionaceae bacterium]|jgi:CMP/dCMP kinase|nr:(d)CMP kinase [Pseudobdellovibrionaceae bacterium]
MIPVITIDGPAASGKSSVSRKLSERLGWDWVSTGAFYRGVGFLAYESNMDLQDEEALVKLILDKEWEVVLAPEKTQFFFKGKDISSQVFVETVGSFASQISSHPGVRDSLLQAQRSLTQGRKGLVAEGRDCGTVVFPSSPLKIFLTADQSKRASRRVEQGGGEVKEILKAQQVRDEQDTQRKSAPLLAAEDAVTIDTTDLSLDQVVDQVETMAIKLFNF